MLISWMPFIIVLIGIWLYLINRMGVSKQKEVLERSITHMELAAFFYLIIKRRNLIWSLVTGKKFLQDSHVDVPRLVSPWMAMSVLVLSGSAVWLLLTVAQPV